MPKNWVFLLSFEFFPWVLSFFLSSEGLILEFTFSLEFSRSSWRIRKSFSTSQSMVICYAATHLVYLINNLPCLWRKNTKENTNFLNYAEIFSFELEFEFFPWVLSFFPLEFFSRWPNWKPDIKTIVILILRTFVLDHCAFSFAKLTWYCGTFFGLNTVLAGYTNSEMGIEAKNDVIWGTGCCGPAGG